MSCLEFFSVYIPYVGMCVYTHTHIPTHACTRAHTHTNFCGILTFFIYQVIPAYRFNFGVHSHCKILFFFMSNHASDAIARGLFYLKGQVSKFLSQTCHILFHYGRKLHSDLSPKEMSEVCLQI